MGEAVIRKKRKIEVELLQAWEDRGLEWRKWHKPEPWRYSGARSKLATVVVSGVTGGQGWVGGGQCGVRGWAAPSVWPVPSSPAPAPQLRRCALVGHGESPASAAPLAPEQHGRGRGRHTGWARAAASGEGSVDSWSRPEGLSWDAGGCHGLSKTGERPPPPVLLAHSGSWGSSAPGDSEERSL